MPGYEPFLLCDLHVHTRWSDGALSIREVCDLYGRTGQVDVIAITDHILMERDWLARLGTAASLGRRRYSVRERDFPAYLADVEAEADRAMRLYGLLVVPGAEITQNHLRARRNSHVLGLGLRHWISADQEAESILYEIRRQGALSVACHPHHRTTTRFEISTSHLWDHRHELADLIDVWEVANRDDLFSITSLGPYPYIANSDFHQPRHLASWKTLLRCEKSWPAICAALRANVDVAVVMHRPPAVAQATVEAARARRAPSRHAAGIARPVSARPVCVGAAPVGVEALPTWLSER